MLNDDCHRQCAHDRVNMSSNSTCEARNRTIAHCTYIRTRIYTHRIEKISISFWRKTALTAIGVCAFCDAADAVDLCWLLTSTCYIWCTINQCYLIGTQYSSTGTTSVFSSAGAKKKAREWSHYTIHLVLQFAQIAASSSVWLRIRHWIFMEPAITHQAPSSSISQHSQLTKTKSQHSILWNLSNAQNQFKRKKIILINCLEIDFYKNA